MSDGEDWKGEPDPSYGFGLFGMLRPQTPEEKAKAAEARKLAIAKGTLAYQTLGRFDPKTTCIKCGSAKSHRARYIGVDYDHVNLGEHEGIQRTCRRCKHTWYERTLDGEAL